MKKKSKILLLIFLIAILTLLAAFIIGAFILGRSWSQPPPLFKYDSMEEMVTALAGSDFYFFDLNLTAKREDYRAYGGPGDTEDKYEYESYQYDYYEKGAFGFYITGTKGVSLERQMHHWMKTEPIGEYKFDDILCYLYYNDWYSDGVTFSDGSYANIFSIIFNIDNIGYSIDAQERLEGKDSPKNITQEYFLDIVENAIVNRYQ